jgi:large subunit ribosomal protein L5
MNFLLNFYLKTYKYDLINRFPYNHTKNLPKLKKIVLNFECKTTELKRLTSALLAVELITNQRGVLTTAKQSDIVLKIRKGNPTGCKITLQKNNMFHFLTKLIVEITPKLKNFNGFKVNRKLKKNMFSYELRDTFVFPELENNYYLFNNLPKLGMTIVTTSKKKEELLYMLRLIKLSFEKKEVPQI